MFWIGGAFEGTEHGGSESGGHTEADCLDDGVFVGEIFVERGSGNASLASQFAKGEVIVAVFDGDVLSEVEEAFFGLVVALFGGELDSFFGGHG